LALGYNIHLDSLPPIYPLLSLSTTPFYNQNQRISTCSAHQLVPSSLPRPGRPPGSLSLPSPDLLSEASGPVPVYRSHERQFRVLERLPSFASLPFFWRRLQQNVNFAAPRAAFHSTRMVAGESSCSLLTIRQLSVDKHLHLFSSRDRKSTPDGRVPYRGYSAIVLLRDWRLCRAGRRDCQYRNCKFNRTSYP
jgi:hypothetical protein